MQQLMNDLLEKAKTDHEHLIMLKNVAVKCQMFELAANLREIEKELFPESPESIKIKSRAKDLNDVFRMVDLNISPKLCFKIDETIKSFNKKKGKFSVRDSVLIMSMTEKLFFNE